MANGFLIALVKRSNGTVMPLNFRLECSQGDQPWPLAIGAIVIYLNSPSGGRPQSDLRLNVINKAKS